MAELLEKGYDPKVVEEKWYKHWEQEGYFHADENDDSKPPFCIVYPPTNVTGTLHMGHALTVSIQDMVIRWRRMMGDRTLWLPGTDHAGIATQIVVERDLRIKENKSRYDLGREDFLKRVWKWKEEKGGRIYEQLRVLGASLDWDRERFTMDEGCSKAVMEAFVRLYKEGLIYRADRLINWCPRCHTALSDLEVEHQENVAGELWSFAYPLSDGTGEIVVATTRPETMLGDTAVAVHPDDERYKSMIGKKIKHPLLGYEFKIITDEILVDPAFGTGAVKVTPAHDPNDFEVGQRHNLESINILNTDGTLNENAGRFEGMDRFDARIAVKEAIEEAGFARGREDYQMSIGACSRCNTVIEPFLSKQWFVKIKPLADEAIKAVQNGETVFVPKTWEKTYFEWMNNIRDWCISRQLWWGHRIPAWYCDKCGHITVSLENVSECEKCSSKDVRQDEDVLDTWFSSALWPFSTLGWPDKTKDLEVFYPNMMMETGFDIIFFWVARMMMMGIHFVGKAPFPVVYMHAMVRDAEGRKESKSIGNVRDPLDVIHGIGAADLLAKRKADAIALGSTEKNLNKIIQATKKEYPKGMVASGADALRFTLVSMVGAGRDIKLDIKRVEGYRFFANKIWNASRFILMNFEGYEYGEFPDKSKLSLADKWILSRIRKTAIKANDALERYRYDIAAMSIYHFFWDEFCDWYIEFSKPQLYGDNTEIRAVSQAVLNRVLESALRLLHPFMPFITEEIWQKLPKDNDSAQSIMLAKYPVEAEFVDVADFEKDEIIMSQIQALILEIRNIRGECGIVPSAKIPLMIKTDDADLKQLLKENYQVFNQLISLSELTFIDDYDRSNPAAKAVITNAELYVPLKGLVDLDEELKRVNNQLLKVTKELEGLEKRLSNKNFVAKAPTEVVTQQRERVIVLKDKSEKLTEHVKDLEG